MTPEKTVDQLNEMSAAALVEYIAQVLYDRAEIASRNADEAIVPLSVLRYEKEERLFCEAAEIVRAIMRD